MGDTTVSRVVSPRINVLAAWMVSHAVATAALVLTPDTTDSGLKSLAFYRGLYRQRLTFMDGGWFKLIIENGYPRGPLPDRMNEWPFFPLYAWLVDVVRWVGMGTRPAMIVVAWVAGLAVLWGAWRLVDSRYGARAAVWSVWLLALAPGSIGLTMTYSDGVFVAGVVWSLVVADRIVARPSGDAFDPRFVILGLVALVATASRPNGFLLVAGLLIVALRARRRMVSALSLATPSVVFLGSWMAYAHDMTGDAFAFMTSKGAWLETTVVDFVTDPLARPAIVFHMVVLVVTLVIAWPTLRTMPAHWILVAAVLTVPSMILGVEGLARYVFMAVPLTIAMAVRVVDAPAAARNTLALVSSGALVFLCVNVVRYTWVP